MPRSLLPQSPKGKEIDKPGSKKPGVFSDGKEGPVFSGKPVLLKLFVSGPTNQ